MFVDDFDKQIMENIITLVRICMVLYHLRQIQVFYVDNEFLLIEFSEVSFLNLGCLRDSEIKLFEDNKIRYVVTDFRCDISTLCLIFD